MLDKTEQLAGLVAGAYLKECGIKDPTTILDKYNEWGIKDDEAIMLICVTAFYQKSIYRKTLR